ncbi:unnamed protein product [Rotaria sp. Silwood1]|nr:unnamed protein product [Rotaria sp. Silwood1]
MNTLNNLNSVELFDDIDHLLFLCDRLSNRLLQVNSYVDEVKQTWMNKRHSIELDSNISPIVAQKVSKCNQVLLNVAEKLAIVELQTESLHNLQSSITNILLTGSEKREVCPSMSSINQLSERVPSSFVQMSNIKNENVNTGFLSQRNISSNTGRSLNDQQVGFNFQNPLHVTTNSSTNVFTPRNTATLFQQKYSLGQQSLEQIQLQQQSAFHRPSSTIQKDNGYNQSKISSQNLLISQTSDFSTLQKSIPNGSISDYQQQSSSTRPSTMSDTYSSRISNQTNGKVRVKMQVIKANTIWHNADIPIIDHPSAFFVCNQDPRVAEQFSIMSIEMNNYYNKSTNITIPLRNPSIGDFCVARFSEDNLWYRARVVLIQDESILIVFIDYGNSETKPANEIYPLQESLARLPAMTVACTLAEAFPRNENFWTSEATQIFTALVKNRIVEVQFQQGIGQQWPLHFVKIILDGQSITQHPKLAPYIVPAHNEEIAMHFNDKLTSMEYILYNVAVGESDIYNDSNVSVNSWKTDHSGKNAWFHRYALYRLIIDNAQFADHSRTSSIQQLPRERKIPLRHIISKGDPREFLG